MCQRNSLVSQICRRQKFLKEYPPGVRSLLVKSARGPHKDQFAVVWLFKSEATRDRYFTADGKPNELEKAALERVKPVEEKLKSKYGTYTITYMDDWVVQ